MKRNDIKALHDLSSEQLLAKGKELQAAFGKARMEHRVGRLKNVRILSGLRDDMARVASIGSDKKKAVKA